MQRTLVRMFNRNFVVLACIIDITVALVPAFLLWNVQMRRQTKLVLDALFALGLVTAAMSIGRAAAINYDNITTDSTCEPKNPSRISAIDQTLGKLMPNKWFGMVEEKCGIIFACGPAVRQFFAYRAKTGSFLPSKSQGPRNEDFTRMRRRITLRDVFWFRPNALAESRATQPKSRTSLSENEQTKSDVEATAQISVLDTWWGRLYRAIPGKSPKSTNTVDTGQLKENKVPLTDSTAEKGRIERKYKKWGLTPRNKQASNGSNSTSAPFLLSNSGTSNTETNQHFEMDSNLGEVLADPVRSLVPASKRMSAQEGEDHNPTPAHGFNSDGSPDHTSTWRRA